MDVRALDPSLQQSTAVGLGSITPLRPQSSEAVAETASSQRQSQGQGQSSNGVVLMQAGAEEEAERLSYDQPSGRQNKALVAYDSVALQQKREQLQQMMHVDLYA